jgi:16S rRNA (uracil1498-N3)-methyltransferase
MRRFIVPQLVAGTQSFALPPEIAHHIVRVLRLGPADNFILCNGAGLSCRVVLEETPSEHAQVRVLEWYTEAETAVHIELIQGLPKKDRFELVLQKNTELGVSAFAPVYTRRCQGRIAAAKVEKKLQRWEKIVQEAARQSGRSRVPGVERPQDLEEALEGSSAALRLVLWEEADLELSAALPQHLDSPAAGIVLLVGPEGGLERTEVENARASGFIPVRFGPRILRTETAGFAVVAVLQYLYGDTGRRPA